MIVIEMTQTYQEYRPVMRRPASGLDSALELEQGYVEEVGQWKRQPSDVSWSEFERRVRLAEYLLRRSEETLAYVHHWQVRTVTAAYSQPYPFTP